MLKIDISYNSEHIFISFSGVDFTIGNFFENFFVLVNFFKKIMQKRFIS